ncbi:hypothetical protein MMAD_25570 [Mycolicibacterium madagascariense]|uniref:Uncharacterized protein n=1 Tax=Mycolicibacterium madagascariense TaxID=212765 RepID=A0A7I7XGD2_9MYCO|nr:hypothetical protein [Mycolicibacterium madagascariense]MCV7013761.1 hypothetical protein [Mycolicibacterium madagascariense]BBZ28262.1 hypothetical protein MMAD_25570 [Mycolicibacterium madagascariense]
MTIKRAVYASTLAAGVAMAGLFGAGLGTASADPGPGCNQPNRPPCGQDQHDNGPGNNNWGGNDHNGPGNAPVDWQHRNVDQARQDHQPFNWNGQQVYPVPAGNGQGWGFWFGPVWIPL